MKLKRKNKAYLKKSFSLWNFCKFWFITLLKFCKYCQHLMLPSSLKSFPILFFSILNFFLFNFYNYIKRKCNSCWMFWHLATCFFVFFYIWYINKKKNYFTFVKSNSKFLPLIGSKYTVNLFFFFFFFFLISMHLIEQLKVKG